MTSGSEQGAVESAIDKPAVKELMLALVEVPSPQTELMEAEPQVRAFIREAVEPRLRRLGIDEIQYDSMGNLVARLGEGASGRRLMMISNAMNHPAASMPAPYAGRVVEGSDFGLPGEAVLGRGLSEQKATMAAMLSAIEALVVSKSKLQGELIFVCCTSGETGRHDSIRCVVEEGGIRADMALLGGSSLEVSLGNRGRLDIFVRVMGEASHSGTPWAGCNAITGAGQVMAGVLAAAQLPQPHPTLGRATLTFTHVRSYPDATHTVQGRCDLTIDRRLMPGEDPDEVFADIERIVRQAAQTPDPVSGRAFEVEIEKGPFMYPSLVAEDSAIVRLVDDACRDVLGREPKHVYSSSAFDQGYLNHVGIPTANFGPGENRFAHTDFDMASVDRTFDAARVYARMIHGYLG